MELLRTDSARAFTEVDRRIRIALLAAAQASGVKARMLMRKALANGPSPGGATEAARWFGADLEATMNTVAPVIVALNDGMPGFSAWLERTGYGDDLTMIRAILAWVESDPECRAIAERARHATRQIN